LNNLVGRTLASLLLLTPVALGANGADAQPLVAVLASPHIRSAAAAQQAERALAQAVDYLHLDGRRLPPIVIFLVSAQSAEVQGIPAGAKLLLAYMRGPRPVYHVWIMATPNEATLTQAVVMALNAEFELHLDRSGVEQTTLAICRRIRATVPVKALRSSR
jgi:hypothetical protein